MKSCSMKLCSKKVSQTPFAALFLLLTLCGLNRADGESISLQPSKDNTLYEFDPTDPDSPLNSNGAGDFFSAGRTRSRGLLRRGLLQFDLSTIPAGAVVVPGTVALTLEVVDAPCVIRPETPRVSASCRWNPNGVKVRLWPMRASAVPVAGECRTAGDATWLHAIHDPSLHHPRMPDPRRSGILESSWSDRELTRGSNRVRRAGRRTPHLSCRRLLDDTAVHGFMNARQGVQVKQLASNT